MFAGLVVPAAWIVFLALTGALDPKVVTEMIHRSGLRAVRFLTLALLVTPLMRGARYPKLVAVRRMVGVAAFSYAAAHLTLYVVDQHFALLHVASEIALRFHLTIGVIAWLGLAALAATSTDAMIRRLGGERWKTLHSLVYAIAAIALLHFMIQAKADVSEPVMMTGFLAILMLFRVFLKRGAPAWGAALAAALVSPVLTVLIEATWYALVRHIDFRQALDADMAYRPSAYVAVAGVAFLGVTLARKSAAPRGRRRRAAGAVRQPLKRIRWARTAGPRAACADFWPMRRICVISLA